jgi:hypothetical protein
MNAPPAGPVHVTFEDYVGMSGAAAALGYQGMLAHYKIMPEQWQQIAGHWNSTIPTNPQYMQYGILVEQEKTRLQTGGQPRAVTIQAGAPAAAAAPPAPGYPQQPGYNQSAQQFGQQVGSAFSAFGNALGSFVDGAVGGFTVGARVTVTWSDGNRYPGTVVSSGNGQVQVAFPNGQQVWVPQHAVSIG